MVIPTTTGTEGATSQRGAPTAPAGSTLRTSLTTSGAMKHPSTLYKYQKLLLMYFLSLDI